jgi:acetylornithine deacetylase
LDEREQVLRRIQEEADEIVSFARKLVRVPSVFGDEQEAQEIVARKLSELGLFVDVWEPNVDELRKHRGFTEAPVGYANRPDVVGTMKGSGGGKSLILNGHIDVVSPEPVQAWTHDPWEGTIEKGRLYGRGACDMKGGLAAVIYAVKAIHETQTLKGDIFVESVIEEEIGGPGGTLATLIRGYRADAALIAEPFTNICVSSAGVCWFRVRIIGKTEHAGRSHLGVNAIGKAMKIYQALIDLDAHRAESKRYPLAEKEWGRSCNLSVGSIRGGDWPSTVAGWAELECRVGWQPIETMNQVKAEVEETVRKTAELDPWMKNHQPTVEWYGWNAEASETDLDSPIIATLRENANEIIGKEPEVTGSSAADDARWFVLSGGFPAVSLGPNGDNIHGIDEYVQVEDLVSVSKIYAMTILDWCNSDASKSFA